MIQSIYLIKDLIYAVVEFLVIGIFNWVSK